MPRIFIYKSGASYKKDPGIISNTGILIRHLNSLIYEFGLLSVYFRNVADEVNYLMRIAEEVA